jgi:hypothetical protein
MASSNHSSTLYSWAARTLREAAWAPLAVFGVHILLINVFNAYVAFHGIDIPMHFVGGMVIAFFFHRASINASLCGLIGPFHRVTHAVLVFTGTCTTAVFWEFWEFINDHYFGGHSQAGLLDTMGDMSIGIVGGTTFLVAYLLRFKHMPILISQSIVPSDQGKAVD